MTSQVLRTLKKRGYIERHLRTGNEKAKFPKVTMSGMELIKQAIPLVEQVDRRFFEKLGDATKECIAILQKLSFEGN